MSLTFDLRDFKRCARGVNALANQIPFALARSLNDAAEAVRKTDLPAAWAENIRVRNPNFLKAALTTRGTRATKQKLRVELYDQFGRGNLKLHDSGGRAQAKHGALAVPSSAIVGRKGSRGMPKGLQPRNLPNSFVTDGRRPNAHLKQGAVYQRQGSYHPKGSRIGRTGSKRSEAADARTVKLMYVLKPSVPVPADVPLSQTFAAGMRREVKKAFSVRIREAMATARKSK